MNRVLSLLLGAMALFVVLPQARAADPGLPKIAVTDLTYEEKVSSYFMFVQSHEKVGRDTDPFSPNHGGRSAERTVTAGAGEISWIERGELHKFTGDIKGNLIKSGMYRVMEGKPWSDEKGVKLYDVIARIKQGYYPGADYVLFGTITDINSRNEAVAIQATDAYNVMLSMELVADFSLINTKTFEVVAGFTAMGEGKDSRLVNTAGTTVQLSRGKVMREVSASLGENVLAEVQSQFSPRGRIGGGMGGSATPMGQPAPDTAAPTVYR